MSTHSTGEYRFVYLRSGSQLVHFVDKIAKYFGYLKKEGEINSNDKTSVRLLAHCFVLHICLGLTEWRADMESTRTYWWAAFRAVNISGGLRRRNEPNDRVWGIGV